MNHSSNIGKTSGGGLTRIGVIGALTVLVSSSLATAQEEFRIDWKTVDCGGGQSNGDEFQIDATIAQYGAGTMIGPEDVEQFSLTGGFWIERSAACYANCDGAGGLTGNDFQCFLDKFVAADSYADCDGVGGLTGNDFQCFLNKFVAGCS